MKTVLSSPFHTEKVFLEYKTTELSQYSIHLAQNLHLLLFTLPRTISILDKLIKVYLSHSEFILQLLDEFALSKRTCQRCLVLTIDF